MCTVCGLWIWILGGIDLHASYLETWCDKHLPHFLMFSFEGHPNINMWLFIGDGCGSLGVSSVTLPNVMVRDMIPKFSFVLIRGM